MNFRNSILGLALLSSAISFGNPLAKVERSAPVKNMLFFIGDGMGLAAVTGGRVWAYGSEGKLNMERFSTIGLSKTYSSDGFVTDSAASATALASGVKTYNGAIGLPDPVYDPKGYSRELETIVDLAKRLGKSVGIISSARVTHATPASFYAHVVSREEENDIASQIESSGLDLLLGGGEAFFRPKIWKDPTTLQEGYREDDRDIVLELVSKKWNYANSRESLQHLKNQSGPVIGLFNADHMTYDLERDENNKEPSLSELVDFAVQRLSKNPNGYFLMVEGGRIDHAAHDNDPRNLFGDLIAFDNAIGHALDHTNSNETLIVVTADHETAGVALNGYNSREKTRGEEMFIGHDDNECSKVSFASGPHSHSSLAGKRQLEFGPSLFPMEYAAHTAVDVPILAEGHMAHLFSGFKSNEKIPWLIAQAMGGEFSRDVNIENKLLFEK